MKKLKRNTLVFLVLFSIAFVAKGQKESNASKPAIFTFTYNNNQPNDTVTLTIWPHFLSDKKRNFTTVRKYKTVIKNNTFKFKIDSITETVYITFSRQTANAKNIKILDKQLCSPGDSVQINILDSSKSGQQITTNWGNKSCYECEDYKFKGVGAAKYQCLLELKKNERMLFNSYLGKLNPNPSIIEHLEFDYNRQITHVLQNLLITLKKYRIILPVNTYNLIKADVIGVYGTAFLAGTINAYPVVENSLTSEEKKRISDLYKSKVQKLQKLIDFPIGVQVRSARFPVMMLHKSYLESLLYHEEPYDVIKQTYNGLLRERLITNFLIDKSNSSKADSLVKDALEFLKFPPYVTALDLLLKNQQIGSIAYNFAMPDSTGKIIKLSDFKGKLVFIDFWFTGCTGCSYYFKNSVSEAESYFKNNPNIVFITISIDSDKELWYRGLKSGLFTSSDAINLYTNGQGINHPIIKQFYVSSYPHPLLIGKDGKVLNNDKAELWLNGKESLINAIKDKLNDF